MESFGAATRIQNDVKRFGKCFCLALRDAALDNMKKLPEIEGAQLHILEAFRFNLAQRAQN